MGQSCTHPANTTRIAPFPISENMPRHSHMHSYYSPVYNYAPSAPPAPVPPAQIPTFYPSVPYTSPASPSAPALKQKQTEQPQQICWICLQEDEAVNLTTPCGCPRWVHKECMAMWQKKNIGKSEEKKCRFCFKVLPDWKSVIDSDRVPTLTASTASTASTEEIIVTGPRSQPASSSSASAWTAHIPSFTMNIRSGSHFHSSSVPHIRTEAAIMSLVTSASDFNRTLNFRIETVSGGIIQFNRTNASNAHELIEIIYLKINLGVSFSVSCDILM